MAEQVSISEGQTIISVRRVRMHTFRAWMVSGMRESMPIHCPMNDSRSSSRDLRTHENRKIKKPERRTTTLTRVLGTGIRSILVVSLLRDKTVIHFLSNNNITLIKNSSTITSRASNAYMGRQSIKQASVWYVICIRYHLTLLLLLFSCLTRWFGTMLLLLFKRRSRLIRLPTRRPCFLLRFDVRSIPERKDAACYPVSSVLLSVSS